jgi:lipopolysaccharide/colanic/teichoic acid biosynthesis glycosyltransferase
VLLAAAACLAAESGWPVFFRQARVGRNGKPFTLWKLRSMQTGQAGRRITGRGDPRVTRVGAVLRKLKLDELPQLWNIVRGEMQFIGPRPEVPAFVDPGDALWRAVLADKPGLTDLATLVYRNEEEILGRCADPERAYREEILPKKLDLSLRYSRQRTLMSDCKLLLLTIRYSFLPAGFDSGRLAAALVGESR